MLVAPSFRPPPSSPSVTSLLVASGVFDVIDITDEPREAWPELFERKRRSRTALMLRVVDDDDREEDVVKRFVELGGGIIVTSTSIDVPSSELRNCTIFSSQHDTLLVARDEDVGSPIEFASEVKTKYLLNDDCPVAVMFSDTFSLPVARYLNEIPPKMIALRNAPRALVPPEFEIAHLLKFLKHRISFLESTTGGIISSRLLAVPGASAFFISGAVVYTGRGAKRLLSSPSVLRESGLMDRAENYKNEKAYIESKRKYVAAVAPLMRVEYKADWMVVESGTTGPDFFVPGVDRPFTYVGVAGPSISGGAATAEEEVYTKLCRDDSDAVNSATRADNMRIFADFTLQFLLECLRRHHHQAPKL